MAEGKITSPPRFNTDTERAFLKVFKDRDKMKMVLQVI